MQQRPRALSLKEVPFEREFKGIKDHQPLSESKSHNFMNEPHISFGGVRLVHLSGCEVCGHAHEQGACYSIRGG